MHARTAAAHSTPPPIGPAPHSAHAHAPHRPHITPPIAGSVVLMLLLLQSFEPPYRMWFDPGAEGVSTRMVLLVTQRRTVPVPALLAPPLVPSAHQQHSLVIVDPNIDLLCFPPPTVAMRPCLLHAMHS